MKIFNAVVKNGVFTKDKTHTNESLKKLNLWDLVFIDDTIAQVVAFNGETPCFSTPETIFEITEGK